MRSWGFGDVTCEFGALKVCIDGRLGLKKCVLFRFVCQKCQVEIFGLFAKVHFLCKVEGFLLKKLPRN